MSEHFSDGAVLPEATNNSELCQLATVVTDFLLWHPGGTCCLLEMLYNKSLNAAHVDLELKLSGLHNSRCE